MRNYFLFVFADLNHLHEGMEFRYLLVQHVHFHLSNSISQYFNISTAPKSFFSRSIGFEALYTAGGWRNPPPKAGGLFTSRGAGQSQNQFLLRPPNFQLFSYDPISSAFVKLTFDWVSLAHCYRVDRRSAPSKQSRSGYVVQTRGSPAENLFFFSACRNQSKNFKTFCYFPAIYPARPLRNKKSFLEWSSWSS